MVFLNHRRQFAIELLSNVVDGTFLGGGLLGFDSVDELGA